jgi:hypothetical protein
MIKSRLLLIGLVSSLCFITPSAFAEDAPAVSAPVNLASETPSDLVKGNVDLSVKINLPSGDTNTRGLSIRITAVTVSNGKIKIMEWPYENTREVSRKIERASTVVVTAWRDGKPGKALRQSEIKVWRAELPPADLKAGKTDTEPATLNWTIDLVPQAESKPAEQGTDFDLSLKLDGKQFNVYALWFAPGSAKPEIASFKNMAEAKAGLTARKITSAVIIRANESDADTDPVKQLTMYSAGVRNAMCPATFTFWTTGAEDGLLLVRRTSEVKDEFAGLSMAPTLSALPGVYRKQVMFKLKDIGDFSSANKAEVLGPTLFGRLDGKYFKLRLGLLQLTDTPETKPIDVKLRIVAQPDGSANLPGE